MPKALSDGLVLFSLLRVSLSPLLSRSSPPPLPSPPRGCAQNRTKQHTAMLRRPLSRQAFTAAHHGRFPAHTLVPFPQRYLSKSPFSFPFRQATPQPNEATSPQPEKAIPPTTLVPEASGSALANVEGARDVLVHKGLVVTRELEMAQLLVGFEQANK